MPEGQDFQKEWTAMDPRLAMIGGKTPLRITVTLDFEPQLLEAVAVASRKYGCSFEDVIVASVREKFASKADAGDKILR